MQKEAQRIKHEVLFKYKICFTSFPEVTYLSVKPTAKAMVFLGVFFATATLWFLHLMYTSDVSD